MRPVSRSRLGLPTLVVLVVLIAFLPGVTRSQTPGTWTSTDSMDAPRIGHTATLLGIGQVLVAGGNGGTSATTILATAELYDLTSGNWIRTGSMTTPRWHHTATPLPTGQVLVAGGADGVDVLESAELYDPRTRAWTPTGPMGTARVGHTATLLPDGKVLVAGGSTPSGFAASAELYDPATGTWTPTGSMTTSREVHTAILLPTGQVLVAGGFRMDGGLTTATAELYDPATETWSPTQSMSVERAQHTATLLPDGKVLVAGRQHTEWLHGLSGAVRPGDGHLDAHRQHEHCPDIRYGHTPRYWTGAGGGRHERRDHSGDG